MADAGARLRERLRAELAAPVSAEARALAAAIRARHGSALAAVVFYGSCLRRRTAEGVHDFYAVVDDYRSAYASRALAAANAALPPNVFYLELPGDTRLRAKVAVVSRADLARGCGPGARRAGLWARFAQPVAAAWLRDAEAREMLVGACAEAVCTAVCRGLAARGDEWQAIDPPEFWRALFQASYAAELRPEREGASDAIYAEQAPRFDALLDDALTWLAERGAVERAPDAARVRLRPPLPPRARPALGKLLAALQLAKSAWTFGDWLPYALWKLERHSGVRLEASERQRRHPWLFAWPLVFRALRSRALR